MIPLQSIHCIILLLSLWKSSAFVGPSYCAGQGAYCRESRSFRQPRQIAAPQKYVHATVISPFNTKSPSDCSSSAGLDFSDRHDVDTLDQDDDEDDGDSETLSELCDMLDATPTDLLRFESTPDEVRGVYLNRPVKEGDIILSLPLEACLQDDEPPSWMQTGEEESSSSSYNPSDWATRLAASLLDLQLRQRKDNENADIGKGHSKWLSLLPDPDFLRATLPVHWPEETVQSARSTALELAVDSSYFARAEAVEDIVSALKFNSDLAKDLNDADLRQLCHNALDVVQTRSCRLIQDDNYATPLRVLAPIFDFLNHGSMKVKGDAGANAHFQLEDGDNLVVRADKDIRAHDEVLIDYGDSARPAWRCLLSYGFVPQYNRLPGPNEGATADSDEEDNEAEVYMDGVRYVVGPSHVPFDMVVAAFSSGYPVAAEGEDAEVALTPEVALKLADRISDVAFYLLLEPERDLYDDHPAATASLFDVVSSRQAASLRWSQHRVLMACALGLREFAADANSFL